LFLTTEAQVRFKVAAGIEAMRRDCCAMADE